MARIVFMGTPEFAVPAFAALREAGHKIVAVYSQPPRPAGRGKKPRFSAVHQAAMQAGVPCFTPETLRDPVALIPLKEADADFIVVAAYGLLLPKTVLDLAPCLNIHASLLPRWRGAAPVERSILAGESVTGVTIMLMDEGMDTGAMLLTRETAVFPSMHAGDVRERLAFLGAAAICEALREFKKLTPVPQNSAEAVYAPKLRKEEYLLKWEESAERCACRVRAFAPYPGARFLCGDEHIKALEADWRPCETPEERAAHPGEIFADETFRVRCGDGMLTLRIVQREGRAMMRSEEFLRGFRRPCLPRAAAS